MIEIRFRGEGGEETVRFNGCEAVIGRDPGCPACIPDPSVSRRHARLFETGGRLFLEDLGSTNGTGVDGRPCEKGQPVELPPGCTVMVGRVTVRASLALRPATAAGPVAVAGERGAGPAGRAPESRSGREITGPGLAGQAPAGDGPVSGGAASAAPGVATDDPAPAGAARPGRGGPRAPEVRAFKEKAHRLLLERLNIKMLDFSKISDEEIRSKVSDALGEIIKLFSSRLSPGIDREKLRREIIDEALGLGPLEELLEDPGITEIMVNGHENVFVEKDGRITLSGKVFTSNEYLLNAIERIVHRIGRRIDESSPLVDARLPDGSRVNAVIHPISLVGPCLTIRRFPADPFTPEDLVRFGSVTGPILELLRNCIVGRRDIVVAGGTGTGKTTILNVLSSYIPADERIITIEDSAELKLVQEHVVRMESRPPNIEGKGAITIRDLVRNSLRMRPDRIVVGECRGGEALDMLQAMNTGHDGSLTTVHANSPREALSRLEVMTLMSGMDLPLRAIREQIASAVDIIVFLARMADGSRKITRVTEVTGMEGDVITAQDIFTYRQSGVGEDGRVQGEFAPTGNIPTFLEEMRARGLPVDMDIFRGGES